MLTVDEKRQIRQSVEATKSIKDHSIKPRTIAEAYADALPAYLSDEVVREARDYAQAVVVGYRKHVKLGGK